MQNTSFILLLVSLLIVSSLLFETHSAVDWVQISLDNDRSQTNTREYVLNSNNISPQTFGKIFQRNTIGEAYAQTLYVSNVFIPKLGVTRNIILIATNMNNVYAFDAHDPNLNDPLWQVNFGATVPISDGQLGTYCITHYGAYTDIQHGIGILSTPYVDKQLNTMYLVAFSKVIDGSAPNGYYYMYNAYALDISTGAIKLGPVRIDTEPGFNTHRQLQRPGLVVKDNLLFIGFGSTCDTPSYRGYVFVYDRNTFEKKFVFKPCNEACGIWQSGQGFVVFNDSIIVKSANGPYDPSQNNYATSLLKLKFENDGSLHVVDWFAPHMPVLEPKPSGVSAIDFGPGCATHIPNTNLLVAGGKEPHLYIINKNDMGKFNANNDQVVQAFENCVMGRMYATPVVWKHDNLGYFVYAWAEYDSFKQFQLTVTNEVNANFVPQVFRDNMIITSRFGGFVTVSSNGGKAGTGIVWASHSDRAGGIVKGGILRAYDAEDIGRELWNSLMQPDRNRVGFYPKWVAPTVTEGTVYLAGFSAGDADEVQTTHVNVYTHFTPRIIDLPDTISVKTEDMYTLLKLNVIATGSAAGFSIQWFKDGMELIENQHFSRLDPKTSSMILLNPVACNIERVGTYNMEVRIVNENGQTSKQFKIITDIGNIGQSSIPHVQPVSSFKPIISTKVTPKPSFEVTPKQSIVKPIPQQSKNLPISSALILNFSCILMLVSAYFM